MERERVRRSALTLSVSRLIDSTEQRNISLVSSFLSYRKPYHTQYGVLELLRQVGMSQVPLEHQQPGQAGDVVWLAHVVAVCWGAPQQLAEDIFRVGLGLALHVGVALVHLLDITTLQKATAAANGYHSSVIRRCNEAKLIDGIAEVQKALHKVQEAVVTAEEAFAAVLLKVTRVEEVETWKDLAETVSNATAETATLCLQTIGVAEGKLRAAAAAAAAPVAAPGRLVEALKPSMLTLDTTPIKVRQWKRKLVSFLCRSSIPNWQDVSNQHSVFFGCMESAMEDRVMHHDRYEDRAAVLPADPVPDGSSLVELLDEVYLEEVPLFNLRLEFFRMRQRTGEGETVEQFMELLEARAREAEVHLMTREDLIMFRCHTGVVEEGMLVEWRRLETPSLPKMKRAMTRYKAGKT